MLVPLLQQRFSVRFPGWTQLAGVRYRGGGACGVWPVGEVLLAACPRLFLVSHGQAGSTILRGGGHLGVEAWGSFGWPKIVTEMNRPVG